MPGRDREDRAWALGAIAVALGAAYYNSFSGPFIFDDIESITGNPSIRHFSTAWLPLQQAGGLTAAGRPLVNLSLALNYAISGEAVWSYHGFNLLVHFLSAGLLFGILRRTLELPRLREQFGAVARPMAAAIAVLWAVHPLQTESVTYVIQRAESLMGLFYLLTLYAFIRSVGSGRVRWWQGVSITACLAGMATKEVMASAPLIVLLYDRTFVSGTLKESLRRHWRYFVGLGSGWLVLLGLILASGWRGGTAGFNADMSWWHYALTQCWAIVHYLQLSVWPHPLVFDYGMWLVARASDVSFPALIVIILAAATCWGVWRRAAWGFLGVFFFAVLAPSSSFIPVATQTVAEHRMYLPLASIVVLFVTGGYLLAGRKSLLLWPVVALLFGALTSRRNEDYRSHVAIWADTVAKRPENAFAHYNLAQALQMQQRYLEAVPEYEAAIRLIPDFIEAHTNLGAALQHLGRGPEAEAQYQLALRYDNRPVETLVNLGSLLLAQGRWEEAGRVYMKLLEFEPERTDAHVNLAQALFRLGKTEEAIGQLTEALQLDAGSADNHLAVGTVLMQGNQLEAARQEFEVVLRLRPNDATARTNLEKLAALPQGNRLAH